MNKPTFAILDVLDQHVISLVGSLTQRYALAESHPRILFATQPSQTSGSAGFITVVAYVLDKTLVSNFDEMEITGFAKGFVAALKSINR